MALPRTWISHRQGALSAIERPELEVKASYVLAVRMHVTAVATCIEPSPITSSVMRENQSITSTSGWPEGSAAITSFHF